MAGMDTPEAVELRKRTIESEMDNTCVLSPVSPVACMCSVEILPDGNGVSV
jgi:hypothetical protein